MLFIIKNYKSISDSNGTLKFTQKGYVEIISISSQINVLGVL